MQKAQHQIGDKTELQTQCPWLPHSSGTCRWRPQQSSSHQFPGSNISNHSCMLSGSNQALECLTVPDAKIPDDGFFEKPYSPQGVRSPAKNCCCYRGGNVGCVDG